MTTSAVKTIVGHWCVAQGETVGLCKALGSSPARQSAHFLKGLGCTAEMAHQLRTSTALAEDLSLVTSTPMLAHNMYNSSLRGSRLIPSNLLR